MNPKTDRHLSLNVSQLHFLIRYYNKKISNECEWVLKHTYGGFPFKTSIAVYQIHVSDLEHYRDRRDYFQSILDDFFNQRESDSINFT